MVENLNTVLYSAEKNEFLKGWYEYTKNIQGNNVGNITLLLFMQLHNYALSDEDVKEIKALEEEFLNARPSIKFSYFINGVKNGSNKIGLTHQFEAYAEKVNHILETFPKADLQAGVSRFPKGYKSRPGINDRYSNFRYGFDYLYPNKKIRISAQFKVTPLKHHENNGIESHEELEVSKLFLSMMKGLT
jgi:hypothetical protein